MAPSDQKGRGSGYQRLFPLARPFAIIVRQGRGHRNHLCTTQGVVDADFPIQQALGEHLPGSQSLLTCRLANCTLVGNVRPARKIRPLRATRGMSKTAAPH